MPDSRILLITLSNIGDAVMTTPVLQALHDKFPGTKIDIVADRRSSEIFLNCPYRGEIFHKEKRKFLRGSVVLVNSLRNRKYELIVDLRTDGLVYLLRAKKRLGKWQGKSYGPHAVEQYMGIIRSLHGDREIPDCCLWPGAAEKNYAREVLGQYYGKKILGLGPGANWSGKIWPLHNYPVLMDAVKDDFNAVVLLGDERDRQLSRELGAGSLPAVINLCGRTSLLQATAILKQTRVFIGNDSGLGHLASAVKVPTITIFGPGQPQRYRPWGAQASWLVGRDQDISNVRVADVMRCMEARLTGGRS